MDRGSVHSKLHTVSSLAIWSRKMSRVDEKFEVPIIRELSKQMIFSK